MNHWARKLLPLGIALAALVGVSHRVGRADAPAGRYQIVGETVEDRQTGLTWQRYAASTNVTWEAAKSYCQSQGAGWRLPAWKELLTLLDITRAQPAIDPNAFPNKQGGKYWTASPCAGSTGLAWLIDFDFGDSYSGGDIKTSAGVRCVR